MMGRERNLVTHADCAPPLGDVCTQTSPGCPHTFLLTTQNVCAILVLQALVMGRMPDADAKVHEAGESGPAPGLKVLNRDRVLQIDELLYWVMTTAGNGEIRLVVKDGNYRWIVPSPSLEAKW
jgi:hypothetical protein